jgi:hypothetical protein
MQLCAKVLLATRLKNLLKITQIIRMHHFYVCFASENTSNGHCTFKFSSECFPETYLKALDEHMSSKEGGGTPNFF